MMEENESKTRSDVLIEFLEIAIHDILYYRNIYPPNIFSLKKKYNIPIYVSKHPKVNEYITECLKTAKELLEANVVKRIALVISTDKNVPVEKYVFEIQQSKSDYQDKFFVKIEEVFREYLLRIAVAEVSLKKLPENCTFEIQITTDEQSSVKLNENVSHVHFPWIEAENSEENLQSILPVKSLDTKQLKLNMYIES